MTNHRSKQKHLLAPCEKIRSLNKNLAMNLINKWLRELLYFLTSIPIAAILLLFGAAAINVEILPLAVVLFLGLLSATRFVAKFEIARTNKILRTDFASVEDWFSAPFWSWDGAKERVTSIRGWMTIGYVFLAICISALSILTITFAALASLLAFLSVSLISLPSISRSFQIPLSDGSLIGLFQITSPKVLRLELASESYSGEFNWDVGSPLTTVLASLTFVVALWLISLISRWQARIVEALLSGAASSQIQSWLGKLTNKHRVSDLEVRMAMESNSAKGSLAELSNREREILALMAQGKSNAGIANSLYITQGSVEKHISRILEKLGLPIEENSHRRVLAVLRYLGLD